MVQTRIPRMAVMALAIMLLGISQGYASLIDLGPGSFTPLAPVIDFGEVSLGTVDPVYNFTALPGLGNVTVSFGEYFTGQATGGGFPVTLTDNTPTDPLTLVQNGHVSTVYDGAPGATSPVLSGSPTFNGPISVYFSVPVAGVGLKGGYFDALHSVTIEAYGADGSILGSITNSVTGFEFYGLADSTGANVIQGISFYITGTEPAGFEIDDLTFGAAGAINIPEPSSMLLVVTGLLGILAFARRLKK